MTGTWRSVSAAFVCFAAFAAVGWYVSSHPPGALDIDGGRLRGEFPALARFLTSLGYSPAIVTVWVIVVGLTWLTQGRRWLPVGILGSQLSSQGVIAACKPLFHRARPEGSLGPHLPDYSYPSGHAVTSIVFYAALGLFIAGSRNLPQVLRFAVAAALALCVVGVPWSRLALGAHYVTDVLGGLVFGFGWLLLGVAFLQSGSCAAFVESIGSRLSRRAPLRRPE